MKKKILSLLLILMLLSTMFVLTGCGSDNEEIIDSSDETSVSKAENSEVVQELISTTESYVGYYADVDGDGTVDGVIYADLLIGGSGYWNDELGYYSYDEIDNSKDYYIIQEGYEDDFGTADVLAPVSESTGNDRFYVMSLSNFYDEDGYANFYWYYSAYDNESLNNIIDYTENDFGLGYKNTGEMIDIWNNLEYGNQNTRDIWGLIQNEYENGWFVPSKSEWCAFGDVFSINSDNYSDYNLKPTYWSSSQSNEYGAYYADLIFDGDSIDWFYVNMTDSVRLSTTF